MGLYRTEFDLVIRPHWRSPNSFREFNRESWCTKVCGLICLGLPMYKPVLMKLEVFPIFISSPLNLTLEIPKITLPNNNPTVSLFVDFHWYQHVVMIEDWHSVALLRKWWLFTGYPKSKFSWTQIVNCKNDNYNELEKIQNFILWQYHDSEFVNWRKNVIFV